MNKLQLAWATGLFEGEGTIRINKPTHRNWGSLCVSVVNTDKDVVDFFQQRWPGYMKKCTGMIGNRKQAWVWVIAATKADAFIKEIKPFVVRRKVTEKINHAIKFQAQKLRSTSGLTPKSKEKYREQQWIAYWWMCELNQRGIE